MGFVCRKRCYHDKRAVFRSATGLTQSVFVRYCSNVQRPVARQFCFADANVISGYVKFAE